MQSSRRGFTLVELSIVLVILGLLVGGVLTGQALIRSAELRSILTEKDKYITAVNTFKDKYFALPGDMPNAFSYWGAAVGCANTITPGTGCNGNGDGIVDLQSEQVKAWMHLSRAGLIEGSYSGTGTVVSNWVTLSSANTPKAKFGQAYWNMSAAPCEGCGAGTPDWSAQASLLLSIGSFMTGSDLYWLAPLADISNAEALNIDTKADDGRSMTGKVRGTNATGSCDDDSTDYYSLMAVGADVKGQCAPTFVLN